MKNVNWLFMLCGVILLMFGFIIGFSAKPTIPESDSQLIFTICGTGDTLVVPLWDLRRATIEQIDDSCWSLQIPRGSINEGWEQFFDVKESPTIYITK